MTDDLEFKFDVKLLEGSLICFIGGALCSGGGIGGGAFYLSTFILLLGMDTHVAVPMSKVTIFGIALGGLFVIIPQKHPLNKLRSLIDYNAVMVLQPMVLLGTVVGVFLNVVFPNWLITIGLAALFCVTSYRTLSKGVKLRKKDIQAQKQAAEAAAAKEDELALNDTSDDVTATSIELTKRADDNGGDSSSNAALIDDVTDEVPIVTDDTQMRKKEARESVVKALSMVVVMVGMFVFLYLKGSTYGKSAAGIECGSPAYWGLVVAVFPYMAVVTLFVIFFLRKHKRRIQLEGDLTLDRKQTMQIVFGGFFAGLLSSFLGVGGGVVVGPLLLELGLLPQIFTSSSSTFQYFIMGKLPMYFAFWYWGIGFFSAIVGQLLVAWIIKKTKKQYVVNFMLGIILIICLIIFVVLLTIQIVNDIRNHASFGFHSICESPSFADSSSTSSLSSLFGLLSSSSTSDDI